MAGFGDLIGAGVDLFSGNKASDIERKAQRKAGKYLEEGYGSALDLARPMQDRSQEDYFNLSDKYRSGAFKSPDAQKYQAKSFSYDPTSVFQDPEYQAQMKAGNQAIESGAAGKGMLFSGNTGRALQEAGQNLFAKRSDELYNRARGNFENDRNFDYAATNRAYDANVANRNADFRMASELAGYAPEALDRMENLNLGRAQALADTELGVGSTRANAWRGGGRKAGQITSGAVDLGKKLLLGAK